jgi:hypothetical protein
MRRRLARLLRRIAQRIDPPIVCIDVSSGVVSDHASTASNSEPVRVTSFEVE